MKINNKRELQNIAINHSADIGYKDFIKIYRDCIKEPYNVGDIYNELYDIYKSKYNKKINSLDAKNKKKLNYKKLRLSDNYQYSSEEEKEEQQQKPTKDDYKTLIKQIIDEETDINDLFNKYFKSQRPSDMFMLSNKTNDTEKNNKLVNFINSGLKDLKEEIKKMSEAEIENEDQN